MIDVRNDFRGGLDLDSSYYKMGKDSYRHALNATRDAVAESHDKVITNIVGNQLRDYTLPAGTNQVIGAYGYVLRNMVVYFVYNSNGNHLVLKFDNTTKVTTKIFENLTDSDGVDILGFTIVGKITSVNIFPRSDNESDLLFFLDSLGRPTTMNIDRFIAGEYTPVTRDIIDVGKRPPLSPPSCVYANEASHTVNNTRNKLFRFKYRWVYDDFEKSTCSPISAVPLPANILDDEFTNLGTNNNQITVAINSGPQNVAKVELLVSWVDRTNNWSDFQLVDSIDKDEESITDDTDFSYLFYNDATYPNIDVNESILLFDFIPELANAQEMPNGNVLTYAAVTEGLDRDLEPDVDISIETVEAGSGGSTGSLNGVVSIILDNSLIQIFNVAFSGVPSVGTVIEIYIRTVDGGSVQLGATYTTIDGDTSTQVASAIAASFNSLGVVDDAVVTGGTSVTVVTNFALDDKKVFDSLDITSSGGSADDNSIATWPWSTQRRLGICYYDQKSKTPGVMYSIGITFPEYAENGSQEVLLPYIHTEISHRPPLWAYSYQWVVTKEPTQWLFFECIDVNTDETDYLYFDITNLRLNAIKFPTTAAVISWTFQDGDRMRLIRRMDDDVVFDDTYDIAIEGIVVDPDIDNTPTTGTFVKVKNIPPFDVVDYSTNFFVIQLYRPGQSVPTDENQVFYEFGIQYPILNPGTADRVHAGGTTDQSADLVTPAETDIYSGDSYFRLRTVALSETGVGQFYIQDRNFVDFYISAVSSVGGRPLVIDINAKRAYYSATGRHGQAYQANTSVNGLNRFYPADFYDVDISYGDIMRLAVNDRRIWVFQKFKVGQLPLFSQINKEPDGTAVNVVTSQLINPVDYYAGNWGIGTASTSLVVFNYVAYFCDNINGVVLRLSKDGLTPLSILFNVNSWANKELPLRNSSTESFIYGGYDQRLNNYIMALEQAIVADAMEITRNFQETLLFGGSKMISIDGVPYAGDVISTTLSDTFGNTSTYSYTVVSGDTAVSVMANLAAVINTGAFFFAQSNLGINTFFPPASIALQQTSGSSEDVTGTVTITYGPLSSSDAQTLTFSENRNDTQRPSFESFLSFKPEMMCSLGVLLIGFKNGSLWTNDSTVYNQFFGENFESTITFVFNQNELQKKTWQNVTLVSSGIWDCPEISTDVSTYGNTKQQSSLVTQEFQLLEGMPSTTIKRDANSRGGKWNGNFMKGSYMIMKFRKQSASSLQYLSVVSVGYKESPLVTV